MTPTTPGSIAAVLSGAGDLPKLTLAAPDGARAEVYLYGAHVASWVPAGGVERLFLSGASAFRAGAPIRGGVPIAFPQFGATGPLPLHGLARLMPWELVKAEAVGQSAVARFHLTDTEDSRRAWGHPFRLELSVTVGGQSLSMELAATNPGSEAFDFTAALHTYLAVADIATAAVEGLSGVRYRDAAAAGIEVLDPDPCVRFRGEVNRVYFDAPHEARLDEAGRTTIVRKAGFPDVVVWNPGAARCATMTDLEPDDYHRFVCIEAAVVGKPVRLAPGERWQGTQTLLA
jgi:glucose-6-phosphate 1-epimerase